MRNFSFKLKNRILASILPAIIIALGTISVLASGYAKRLILERYSEQKEAVAQNVRKSMELIDSGYRMLDQSLAAEMEKAIREYKEAFEAAGGDARTISLEKLKKQLSFDYELMVIDINTTIIKSTVPDTVNFNFSKFNEKLGNKISQIRLLDEIYHERIRTDVVTGYFSKFSYMATEDDQYVLEIAYKKGDLKELVKELDTARVVQELIKINTVVSDIRIFDIFGYQLESSGETYGPTKESQAIVSRAMKERDYEIQSEEEDKRYIYVDLSENWDEIADSSKIIEITYDKAPIHRMLSELSYYINMVSLLVVILIAGALVFLSSRITRPITQLAKAAGQVAGGEYREVVLLSGIGEIRSLTEAFNTMVDKIKDDFDKIEKQREQLESYNRNLEQMVSDRTRELRQALAKSKESQALLSESNFKFESLFHKMQEGFAIHEIIYDDKREPYDYLIVDANPAFEAITKSAGITGKTWRELDNAASTQWFTACARAAQTGEAYCVDNYTDGDGRYYTINVFSIAAGTFATLFSDITAQVISREEIRKEKKLLEHILDDNISGYWDYHMKDNKVYFSPGYKKMLGYEEEEMENTPDIWESIVLAEDIPSLMTALDRHIASHGAEPLYNQIRFKHKDGSIIWVITSGHVVEWDKDNQPIQIIGKQINISGLKRLEKALNEERELLRATLLSIGDGVITTDIQGRIEIVNEQAQWLTGWTQEEAYGRAFEEVFHIVHEYTKMPCESPIRKVLDTGANYELGDYTVLVTKSGREIPIEDSAAPIRDDNGNVTGAVLIFRDFTEKKEKQERIEFLSFHDQLTGVYNRRYLEEQLQKLDHPDHYPLSVVMLDVNGLKLINDAFGHAMGDRVLKRATQILQELCRSQDIIARYGGDEFVIMLPKMSYDEVDLLLQRMTEHFQKESVGSVAISVSGGCSTKQDETQEMGDILKMAEDHMYRRKLSESKSMRYKTVEIILKTLHEKSEREKLHSEGVKMISEAIGAAMGFSLEDIRELGTAGLMHDIGKIAIDLSILDKPDMLNISERIEIERHPEQGYQILRSITDFAKLAEYVLAHHERWDGTGYPGRLKGEEIPLKARIISIADSYHAMVNDRPYRKALSKRQALEELQRNSGTQFDPVLVSLFIEKVADNL